MMNGKEEAYHCLETLRSSDIQPNNENVSLYQQWSNSVYSPESMFGQSLQNG